MENSPASCHSLHHGASSGRRKTIHTLLFFCSGRDRGGRMLSISWSTRGKTAAFSTCWSDQEEETTLDHRPTCVYVPVCYKYTYRIHVVEDTERNAKIQYTSMLRTAQTRCSSFPPSIVSCLASGLKQWRGLCISRCHSVYSASDPENHWKPILL